MHTIATLSDMKDRETGEVYLSGPMKLGTIKSNIRIRMITKRGPKSPTHCVEIWKGGEWHPFGVAWLQAPHGGGEDYYSCRLSHPMWLRNEVLVSAFPPSEDGDGDEWHMVWKPQTRPADPLASDGIPY
ncbi:MAG: DUF736 family protein [Parvibaculaceae bacterium]